MIKKIIYETVFTENAYKIEFDFWFIKIASATDLIFTIKKLNN